MGVDHQNLSRLNQFNNLMTHDESLCTIPERDMSQRSPVVIVEVAHSIASSVRSVPPFAEAVPRLNEHDGRRRQGEEKRQG